MVMPDLGLLSRQGHTFNENDSVHSTIERAYKAKHVYTTHQWATVIQMAKRSNPPYGVHEMNSVFFSFKSLSDNVKKNFDLDEEKNKVLISESRIWKLIKRNLTF